MGVASVTQEIWRGANYPPVIWGFGDADDPLIPEESLFELEVRFNSAKGPRVLLIPAGHDTLPIDYATGTVSWEYSPEQVAEMDRTSPITYSLRFVLAPVVQVWVVGNFMVKG